jgi:hypothetical protein
MLHPIQYFRVVGAQGKVEVEEGEKADRCVGKLFLK